MQHLLLVAARLRTITDLAAWLLGYFRLLHPLACWSVRCSSIAPALTRLQRDVDLLTNLSDRRFDCLFSQRALKDHFSAV